VTRSIATIRPPARSEADDRDRYDDRTCATVYHRRLRETRKRRAADEDLARHCLRVP
jgi:hypothetical protein